MKELLKLANDDYQKRGKSYPKSNIPDSIAVSIGKGNTTIEFNFKNTSDSDTLSWYEKSSEYKAISRYSKGYEIEVTTSQDGDYEDDWIQLTVSLTKKPPQKQSSTTKKAQTQESDDICYTYCYILSTQEQRKAIDLTKHKSKLEAIIKGFFGERLISVVFDKESYTLSLKDEYEVADKRRLGRVISDKSDLKQYVRRILYNNNQDSSGQLFRLKKIASVVSSLVKGDEK
ncbi:MAG: hypothetical protein U9O86_04980 [Campylobacterota bacterium]|nr:hypothetical protein [Campylobacterota bacterium]